MPAASPPFKRFEASWELGARGCWNWTRNIGRNGYGQIKVFGKMVSAHRYAYSQYKGPIPEGAEVLHRCDNKRCVNPQHLRLGTHAENMAEAAERNLMRSGQDHPNFGKTSPRPHQANRVRVLGRDFDSQKQAERALQLGSGTVRYWLRTNAGKAQLISKGNLDG